MLMFHVLNVLNQFVSALQREEEGQGLVEYALIMVLVSIAVIATMGLLATEIDTVFSAVITAL